MTWQEALRLDVEARIDFEAWLEKNLIDAQEAVDRAVEKADLHSSARALGKKQSFLEVKTAFEADMKEGVAHATHRRQAGRAA